MVDEESAVECFGMLVGRKNVSVSESAKCLMVGFCVVRASQSEIQMKYLKDHIL
jgi:hypothetical protein